MPKSQKFTCPIQTEICFAEKFFTRIKKTFVKLTETGQREQIFAYSTKYIFADSKNGTAGNYQ